MHPRKHDIDTARGIGTGELDEVTLVSRAQLGDEAAFRELARHYQAPLFRHALRLLRDRGAAEDLVQETLTIVWKRLPTLTRPQAFRGWLYQIATRRGLNQIRRRRDSPAWDEGAENRYRSGLATSSRTIRRDLTPTDPAIGSEQQARTAALRQALDALPEGQAVVWIMREIDRLSYDEIAAALSLSASTVRGRITRARRELAERMEPWR